MTINFLPRNVLSAPVNFYYFLWAPFASAWHNYKVAVFQSPSLTDKKTQNSAQENLKSAQNVKPSFLEMKMKHFFTHLAVGLLLSIPILNIILFGFLVIKTKENLVPAVQNTGNRQEKSNPAQRQKPTHSTPKKSLKRALQTGEFFPKDKAPVLKREAKYL